MFDGHSPNHEFDFEPVQSSSELCDVEGIIEACQELPQEVRSAPITSSYERILDNEELKRLTNPESIENQDTKQLERLQRRHKSLHPSLGLSLTCVLIRLPGIRYTLEIERASASIVHLEWQLA